MDSTILNFAEQVPLAVTGSRVEAGQTLSYGPFNMRDFSGILLDFTRTDDGTNGTMALVLEVDDHASGTRLAILDGAGAAVAMNDWAAGENVRRQLQVHPTSGPIPSNDADGVFTVGTTGVASTYYRQTMPADFYIKITGATDASVFFGTLHFLR